MIGFGKNIEESLISLAKEKSVYLEGNIIKLVKSEDASFKKYLEDCLNRDTENRKKRLEITRQVQDQNKELQQKADENVHLMDELKIALSAAETAKTEALRDLSVMQQRTQFELIGNIVQVALFVIVGVGFIVTGMYVFAMFSESTETTLIGNTWSNLFGILLTNSFSIIGTIMGVKYASEQKEQK